MKAINKLLYHGATGRVDKPLVSVGRPELDFGPGFYLTCDRGQAEKWARTKASRKINGIACLNVYSFDSDAFTRSDFREELRHQVCIRHQIIIDSFLKFEECIEL